MYFYDKIKSIKKSDLVLEVGPGYTPFYRSNVLLEKVFDTKEEALEQTGASKPKVMDKKIVYYKSDKFPFSDKEFDYVVCSHVLEHIPIEQLKQFISELVRIAPKGYIEIPLYSFEVLANVKRHLSLINTDINNKLYFLEKNLNEFNMDMYKEVRKILTSSNINSHIISSNTATIVCGFEWFDKIDYEIVSDFNTLIRKQEIQYDNIVIDKLNLIKNRLNNFLNPTKFKQMLYNRFQYECS